MSTLSERLGPLPKPHRDYENAKTRQIEPDPWLIELLARKIETEINQGSFSRKELADARVYGVHPSEMRVAYKYSGALFVGDDK